MDDGRPTSLLGSPCGSSPDEQYAEGGWPFEQLAFQLMAKLIYSLVAAADPCADIQTSVSRFHSWTKDQRPPKSLSNLWGQIETAQAPSLIDQVPTWVFSLWVVIQLWLL